MDKVIYFLTNILVTSVLGFLFSYPIMLLWNDFLVPATTIFKVVSWSQMWGITVLVSLLFNSTIYNLPDKS